MTTYCNFTRVLFICAVVVHLSFLTSFFLMITESYLPNILRSCFIKHIKRANYVFNVIIRLSTLKITFNKERLQDLENL